MNDILGIISPVDLDAASHQGLRYLLKEVSPEGVWLGDGSRDCKYLTRYYPEDRYGVFTPSRRPLLRPQHAVLRFLPHSTRREDEIYVCCHYANASDEINVGCHYACASNDRKKWYIFASGVDGTVPGSTCSWLLNTNRLTLKGASYFCENGFANGCVRSCSKLKQPWSLYRWQMAPMIIDKPEAINSNVNNADDMNHVVSLRNIGVAKLI
ncbi:hypothetical protein DPMN_156895 [Dreissena polymorpha]|uniref:Uncharacterized protein n=1 Tax=Dreissena polymorpha TaxID=45954 RepID=A0A9D4JB78_DREPO|nr:hypothetical protein DPMN_156895 [Dreissena polymorpha]